MYNQCGKCWVPFHHRVSSTLKGQEKPLCSPPPPLFQLQVHSPSAVWKKGNQEQSYLWVDVILFSWGALVFFRSSASKLYHSCPPLELSSINSQNRIKLTSEKPLGPHWISWLLTASEASAVPSFPMVPVLLLGVKESPSPILPLKLPLIGFCTNCYEIAELEKHKLVQNLYTPLHINKLLWVKL